MCRSDTLMCPLQLRESFKRGVLWTGVGRYSNFLFQFIVTMILARLLDPSDFGLLAMVVVYTGFVNLLSEAGIGSAIIQKKELDRGAMSSVFWFSVIVGLVMVGITVLLAPWVEKFFSYDGLSLVVQVMSINFLLLSLNSVPMGLLQREMKFKQIAILEICSSLASGGLAVWAAFGGYGYWALVFQVLSAMAIRLPLTIFFSGWLPGLCFDFTVIKSILSFSGYVLGFSSINYWARNADNLLVGKFLGATALGFYNQAYKLLMMPLQVITGIINPSLHPIFASIQDEKARMGNAYLKLIQIIALISFPLGGFLLVFAHPVIYVLWGPRWLESVPVLQILAILAMVQPVVSTSGSVFLAANQPRLLFILGGFNSAVMVAGIVIGLPYGISGVAVGYSASFLLIVLPLTMFYVARTLGFSSMEYLKIALGPMGGMLLVLSVGEGGMMLLKNSNQFVMLAFGAFVLLIVLTMFLFKYWRSYKIEMVAKQ